MLYVGWTKTSAVTTRFTDLPLPNASTLPSMVVALLGSTSSGPPVKMTCSSTRATRPSGVSSLPVRELPVTSSSATSTLVALPVLSACSTNDETKSPDRISGSVSGRTSRLVLVRRTEALNLGGMRLSRLCSLLVQPGDSSRFWKIHKWSFDPASTGAISTNTYPVYFVASLPAKPIALIGVPNGLSGKRSASVASTRTTTWYCPVAGSNTFKIRGMLNGGSVGVMRFYTMVAHQ